MHDTLLASLAWTASAVFFISKANAFAHRWLDLHVSATTDTKPVDIPDDLTGFAMMESERHAQDSTLEAIREAYLRYSDWNKVRAAMGLAARDA
jgi:hypothetical protein